MIFRTVTVTSFKQANHKNVQTKNVQQNYFKAFVLPYELVNKGYRAKETKMTHSGSSQMIDAFFISHSTF